LDKHCGDLRQQADKNKNDISLLFEQVREIINDREVALKRQIDEGLAKEEAEI
jgi:hypothetical protein